MQQETLASFTGATIALFACCVCISAFAARWFYIKLNIYIEKLTSHHPHTLNASPYTFVGYAACDWAANFLVRNGSNEFVIFVFAAHSLTTLREFIHRKRRRKQSGIRSTRLFVPFSAIQKFPKGQPMFYITVRQRRFSLKEKARFSTGHP